MASRRTRVTPGSAAARLARWRWHRNPKRGRRAATSRARLVSRAEVAARINKASKGARNAVMRSILAQVMAGKVRVRGSRISAAVKRGIRRGRHLSK